MMHSIVTRTGRAVLMLTLLAGAAAILLKTEFIQAQGKGTSETKVTVTATASKPDASGVQVVVLNLDVSKGWYIYANPVRNEDFEGNHTLVTVKNKPATIKVEYPAGTPYGAGDFKCQVYEGKVAIRALVQRAPGDNGPLNLDVQVNACGKKEMLCLPTGHVPVTIP